MEAVSTALWTWDTTGKYPVATGWNGLPTKTGVLPADLQAYAGVPLGTWSAGVFTPLSASQLIERIRWAEDWIEQNTGILLTPTWVASPPARRVEQARAADIRTTSEDGRQHLGVDYDLEDAAYDFKLNRAEDSGWLIQGLRYRPLRIVDDSATAIKQMAYIYPLLNQYFRVPPEWFVEDLDVATVRVVPATNVQMLPLFAIEMSILGFSDSVPGGIWIQYTAGLTPNDYNSRFRFIKTLVLATAAIYTLSNTQGTLNMGLESSQVLVDGVQQQMKWRAGGAFADLIKQFTATRDELMETAKWLVGGPMFEVIG